MMLFTDLTGLAGIALALALLCQRTLSYLPFPQRTLAMVSSAVFVLLLVPFSSLPPAAYVRGMVGDLSVTSLMLLSCRSMRQASILPSLDTTQRWCGLGLLALASAVLYPLALGVTPYDPYRWGYGDFWFLGALLSLSLAASALRLMQVAATISLAVLAWAVGWSESNNLWDYLLDPMLAIYAYGGLITMIFSRWRSGRSLGFK